MINIFRQNKVIKFAKTFKKFHQISLKALRLTKQPTSANVQPEKPKSKKINAMQNSSQLNNVIDFSREKKRRDLKTRIKKSGFELQNVIHLWGTVDWMIDQQVNLFSIQNCFDFFFDLFSAHSNKTIQWLFSVDENNLAEVCYSVHPANVKQNEIKADSLCDWLVFNPVPPPPEGFNFQLLRSYVNNKRTSA